MKEAKKMAHITTSCRWIKASSNRVIQLLENFFCWWGCLVATNPYKVIMVTIICSGLCALGLLNFRAESNGWKFWLPDGTRFSEVQRWKAAHFVEDTRATITFFTHEENVLTTEGLLFLLDLHKRVREVEFDGKDYSYACKKIPITNVTLAGRRRKREVVTIRKKRQVIENEFTSFGPNDSLAISEIETGNDQDYNDEYINFYGDDEGLMIKNDNHNDNYGNNDLPKEIYCNLVETLKDKCGEFSLLEIWDYDESIISKLREKDIINAINTIHESPVFGYKINYTNYLGQVEYNTTGHLVKAKSIRSIWLEEFDPDNIDLASTLIGFDIDKADPFTMGYEAKVIDLMKTWMSVGEKESKGYRFFFNVGRSFSDEASAPLEYDAIRNVMGYIVMFLYTILTLGNFNLVEQRVYLAAAGICSCIIGCVIGNALTMALGFPYTPLFGLLPFLCLGIGIDDMFVIIRCYNNITEADKENNGLVKNVGVTLRYAGVSITATSLTDIFAFCVGALTSFPALKAFCIASAIAIMATYLLQSSWLVAWMVIDLRRMKDKRDGFIPCIVHKDWQPPKWTQKDLGSFVMSNICKLFDLRLFQMVIIFSTVAMLSIGIFGIYNLKILFDGKTFLHYESYFIKWMDQNEIDFPEDGFGIHFFTQELPYNQANFEEIDTLVNKLDDLTKTHNEWVHYGKKLPKLVSTPLESATGFWWNELKEYITKQRNITRWQDSFLHDNFPMYLSDFLYHEEGAMYRDNFRFEGEISCNVKAPPITAVKLGSLKLRNLQGRALHLPAQNAIDTIMKEAKLPSTTFANSPVYPAWEIDEILADELPMLSLTLLFVMIVVFIILADLFVCFMILCCVIITMTNILGILYFWGMTIDQFSLISTIIGLGLSVDYSVHMAHAFIASKGTKIERTKNGFIKIGPAVLQGGFTTFLAVVFVCNSQSHSYITFFRVNSLTVLFGLFHGLLFLPIILLLFGPDNLEDGIKNNSARISEDVRSMSTCKGNDNTAFN